MNGSAPRTRSDVANGLLKKEMYEYKDPWPVYGLDWSKRPGEKAFRLALGSFIEEYSNKVRCLLDVIAYLTKNYRLDLIGSFLITLI
jgi:WD repeat-containing protein 68